MVLTHQVTDQESAASAHPRGTVHQHIGPLPLLLNEVVDFVEVADDVLGWIIFNGEDQALWVELRILDMQVDGG